ncbi:MAG: YggS family pyridoxal phosphate-dependent enzyme [Caulobacter sp.]|nr:YggS family pyridoxal phosphate-dependent enzyme [Caulobacter sp.]
MLDRIAEAAREAGRSPDDVTLVAVSKQQPDEKIDAMLAAGQRVFGENRVQEAMGRWIPRREGVELRLIGPLQTNKVREAVALFDVIETVDREKLAQALAREMARSDTPVRLYVQVNTGEEPQKAGVAPRDVDGFVAFCRDLGLTVEGLMCIPPETEPAEPHFAMLAEMAARNGLTKLSMGMSADYAAAVRLGATSVRVGSALFGGRG